jgi:hypothetical protein
MSNEIILFQILFKNLEYLFIPLVKVIIIQFIQCGECYINGPNLSKISFFEKIYIAIGHLIFVTFIHFIYNNI